MTADSEVQVPATVDLPVTFHLRDPLDPSELIGKAREIDRTDGQEGVAYTVEQALVVVFHNDPGWLFDRPHDERILDGWVLEAPPAMWADWQIKPDDEEQPDA